MPERESSGSDSEVTLSEVQQLDRYPETNAIDAAAFEKLFRVLGAVTRKSRARLESGREIQRPYATRYARAKLLKLFRSTNDREERKKIINEGHQRDELLQQFLKQGDVQVSSAELGENSARFTVLTPPPGKEITDKPPIILIPGISNDLACVDLLAQEIAHSGRSTIVIGYPESYMGVVSPQFVDAVEQSPSFGPHAKFFGEAIKKLSCDQPEIELWGVSTGGPIVAEILVREPELAKRVRDAVLVNPAGTMKQSQLKLWKGLVSEMKASVRHPSNIAAQVLTQGRTPPDTPEQIANKKKVFGTLMQRICEPSPYWTEAKVRDGGNIVIIAGQSDNVTHCRDCFNNQVPLPNSQMKVVNFAGNHGGPCIRPAETIRLVNEVQQAAA